MEILSELSESKLQELILSVKRKVKEIKNEIAIQKKVVFQAEQEKSAYFYYDDCSEFYIKELEEEEKKLECLIRIKISREKFLKKLKYTLLEVSCEN